MALYTPAEDSYFLSEILKKELQTLSKTDKQKTKLLEIGIGSGIQLKTAFENGIKKENILGVDINPEAAAHCKSLGFNCLRSNLFAKIPKIKKFDIIIFNPPYLQKNKFDKEKDTTGGKKGNETINKFLKQAKNYLNQSGYILLLTSSLTPKFDAKDYKKQNVAIKKLFFEELYVWKLNLK